MGVRIVVSTRGVAGTQEALNQLPFAVSVALNKTAEDVQEEVRGSLRRNFTINPAKRAFFDRMIKIRRSDRATKYKLATAVRVEGPESSTSRGEREHLLTRHEEGGVARARLPHSHPLAIPTREVRPGPYDVAPRRLYPSSLRLVERRSPDGVLAAKRGVKRKIGGSRRSFFVIGQPGSGDRWGVYERVGKGRRDIRMLWSFRERVTNPPRLRFYATATDTINRVWPANLAEALRKALATAR